MKFNYFPFKNIINWVKHIYYALPFGMRGAEDVIMLPKTTASSNDISIQEYVQTSHLGEDLLKGEITQEVVEFRYQTYKVYREASKYVYQGGAFNKIKSKIDKEKIKLSQKNKMIGVNITDSFDENKSLDDVKYALEIEYKDIPKFRIDRLCTEFDVEKKNNGEVFITLHFEKQYDVSQIQTRVFTSELKKIIADMGDQQIKDKIFKNHEIFFGISSISFITNQAKGEEDLMRYVLQGLQGVVLRETKYEYEIVYSVESLDIIDLTAKFYSKEAQDRYDITAPKKRVVRAEKARLNTCGVCGARIANDYDAAITEEIYGVPLCISCLEKKILSDRVEKL